MHGVARNGVLLHHGEEHSRSYWRPVRPATREGHWGSSQAAHLAGESGYDRYSQRSESGVGPEDWTRPAAKSRKSRIRPGSNEEVVGGSTLSRVPAGRQATKTDGLPHGTMSRRSRSSQMNVETPGAGLKSRAG